jgi:hypothetical protein
MAMPIRRAQEAYLTSCEEEVFDARANGASWRAIAAQFMTSCHVLSKWITQTPERKAAWYALDVVAAESQAGKSEEILEDALQDARDGRLSPELTRLAIARSDLAKWHAGVLNRGRYGPPSAQPANLTINLGGLHLTAVQNLQRNPPPPPVGLLEVPEADYEVISEGPPELEALLRG